MQPGSNQSQHPAAHLFSGLSWARCVNGVREVGFKHGGCVNRKTHLPHTERAVAAQLASCPPVPPSHTRSLSPTPLAPLTTPTSPQAALDIALPILGLWLLLKLVNWAADQARVTIDARVASDRGIVDELKRQSTVGGLVLLALRTPAKYMLPPWLLAYTLRTALHIVDLVVNKYQPKLPQLAGYAIQQVGGRLVVTIPHGCVWPRCTGRCVGTSPGPDGPCILR